MLKALELALGEVSAHVAARHPHHLPTHLVSTVIGCHERLLRLGLLELKLLWVRHVVVGHSISIAVETVSTRARMLVVLAEP